jgi:hypothetical protein
MRNVLMREKISVRGYRNKADLFVEEHDTSVAGNKYPFSVNVAGVGGSGHWTKKEAFDKFKLVKSRLLKK